MNNIIQMIPISELQPFENHPFKMRGGSEGSLIGEKPLTVLSAKGFAARCGARPGKK